MQRLTRRETVEAYAAALATVPPRLRTWLDCDLHTEDPIFTGLHGPWPDAPDDGAWAGRSFRVTAHASFRYHQMHLPRDRRRSTVVIPTTRPHVECWWTALHELGHVLHYELFERTGRWIELRAPVAPTQPGGDYYELDEWEAFVGAWLSYFLPLALPRHPMHREWLHDPEVWAFFDALPARP